MLTERASGVLLHLSSLPSRGGIGDLGPAAYAFADFLAASKQQYWQVLPLSPTGFGNSPYSALSAFAGNPLFISIEKLVEDGWLPGDCLCSLPSAEGHADFEQAAACKLPLLEQAAANFLDSASPEARERFDHFCVDNQQWLEGYCQLHHPADHVQRFHLVCLAGRICASRSGGDGKVSCRSRARAKHPESHSVLLSGTMDAAARLLRRAQNSLHRRHGHLRQLRQRSRLDAAGNLRAGRE